MRDTGIGISEEDQARIFERFYRAADTQDSVPAGTGLGLAIAQTITTQYGGKLTVDSELGQRRDLHPHPATTRNGLIGTTNPWHRSS